MAYFPTEGAATKAIKELRDQILPYMNVDNMREFDRKIDSCFSEMRAHIQIAIYTQIANAIEIARNEVVK